jgi:hypothetical protein
MAHYDPSAPFVPTVRVRPKKGVAMPVGDKYTVDAIMLGKDGIWKVLLEGLHIGHDGWLPADNFEAIGCQ